MEFYNDYMESVLIVFFKFVKTLQWNHTHLEISFGSFPIVNLNSWLVMGILELSSSD